MPTATETHLRPAFTRKPPQPANSPMRVSPDNNNTLNVLDYFASLPSSPPTVFPRREWTATSFGIPSYAAGAPVSADEIHWGLKNASVAVARVVDNGEWSALREPAQAVALAVCDKAVQLYVLQPLLPPDTWYDWSRIC